jgi:hypothetical protein
MSQIKRCPVVVRYLSIPLAAVNHHPLPKHGIKVPYTAKESSTKTLAPS